MSEQRSQYLLQTPRNPDTMEVEPPDSIQVSRADLLKDYGLHIARAQHLAKVLGLPPLMTGQQQRKAARER